MKQEIKALKLLTNLEGHIGSRRMTRDLKKWKERQVRQAAARLQSRENAGKSK